MTTRPTIDDADRLPLPGEEHPDCVGYWSVRDEWARLGKRLGALKLDAARSGRPLEEMPEAAALVARFKVLGKELDRRAR